MHASEQTQTLKAPLNLSAGPLSNGRGYLWNNRFHRLRIDGFFHLIRRSQIDEKLLSSRRTCVNSRRNLWLLLDRRLKSRLGRSLLATLIGSWPYNNDRTTKRLIFYPLYLFLQRQLAFFSCDKS
ncbi:hypothetical protein ACFX14_003306 [Malus domestica]